MAKVVAQIGVPRFSVTISRRAVGINDMSVYSLLLIGSSDLAPRFEDSVSTPDLHTSAQARQQHGQSESMVIINWSEQSPEYRCRSSLLGTRRSKSRRKRLSSS